MRLIPTCTQLQRAQVWNSAVFVPNTYSETSAGSFTTTSGVPSGFDVQTPPCFTQNVHVQARAGISTGSGSHASVKAMLPQWHLPRISMSPDPETLRETNSRVRAT